MQVGPAILIEFTAPGGGRGLPVAAPRAAPRPDDAGRRRAGGARPGAGARPGLGRRPERARACCGRWARWWAARRTSSSAPTRTTACRRWSWPGRACWSARWRSACWVSSGVLPMRTSTDTTSYAGTEVAWWVPLVALGLVTAALSYVAGIAAGSPARVAAGVVRGAARGRGERLLGVAAPRRAPGHRPAARRAADPGRRGRGQAGGAARWSSTTDRPGAATWRREEVSCGGSRLQHVLPSVAACSVSGCGRETRMPTGRPAAPTPPSFDDWVAARGPACSASPTS